MGGKARRKSIIQFYTNLLFGKSIFAYVYSFSVLFSVESLNILQIQPELAPHNNLVQ